MSYREALWDGSDPHYAPGITWSRQYSKWKAPKKYIDAGYSAKYYKLADGSADDEHQIARARMCRELTRDMLKWWNDEGQVMISPSIWSYLFNRYLTDKYSPFQDKKEATQHIYRFCIERWDEGVGEISTAGTNHETLSGWKMAMIDSGRTVSYIKRMFTTLRIITQYGIVIENSEAMRIHTILSNMTIKNPKRREEYATRAEAYKIIGATRHAKNPSMALGFLIQFELGLSSSDVIGKWVKGTEGITDNGRQWKDGLTWNDVSDDLSIISKGRNKTDADTINYHIADIKPLQRLLAQTPQDKRTGPLIVAPRTGLPYKAQSWSRGFNRMMVKAGLEGLQCRDLRAGAITEGQQLGATREQLQGFANHKNANTTEIYMRGSDAMANNVIKLRRNVK